MLGVRRVERRDTEMSVRVSGSNSDLCPKSENGKSSLVQEAVAWVRGTGMQRLWPGDTFLYLSLVKKGNNSALYKANR